MAVSKSFINQEQIQQIISINKESGQSIISILFEKKFMDEFSLSKISSGELWFKFSRS